MEKTDKIMFSGKIKAAELPTLEQLKKIEMKKERVEELNGIYESTNYKMISFLKKEEMEELDKNAFIKTPKGIFIKVTFVSSIVSGRKDLYKWAKFYAAKGKRKTRLFVKEDLIKGTIGCGLKRKKKVAAIIKYVEGGCGKQELYKKIKEIEKEYNCTKKTVKLKNGTVELCMLEGKCYIKLSQIEKISGMPGDGKRTKWEKRGVKIIKNPWDGREKLLEWKEVSNLLKNLQKTQVNVNIECIRKEVKKWEKWKK